MVNDEAHGYQWTYQPPPPPAKTPRWLIIVAGVWAVALLVAGIIYALHGKPSVREQTTIVDAYPVVNTATRNVVSAVGPNPVVAVSGFDKINNCKITPVRAGVSYARTVAIFVTPGAEPAMLQAIAAGLPAAYQAHAGPGDILNLSADAGDYVAVSGDSPAPGQVEIEAGTGCRALGGKLPTASAAAPTAAELAPVQAVLSAFHVQAIATTVTELSCGSGRGALRTVEAHAPRGAVAGPLGAALALLAPHPLVSSPSVVAYRTGGADVADAADEADGADVAVKQDSTGLTIDATYRC